MQSHLPSRPQQSLVLGFLLGTLLLATPLSAQQFRIAGNVLDQESKPIEAADILATSPDVRSFRATTSSSEKGEFSLLVLSGSINKLHLTITKPGYATGEFDVDVPISGVLQRDFRLENSAVREAAERARLAAEQAEQAEQAFSEGVAAAQKAEWAQARAAFEKALAIREEAFETHTNLATACWNLNDYAAAERHARRSLELNAEQAQMKHLLAEALEMQGKKDEAQAALQAVAADDPKLRAELSYNRGADLANQKKPAEALLAFEEAVAADPSLAAAHYALGITALGQGELDKTRRHLQRYLELEPDGAHSSTAKQALQAVGPAK